MEQYRTNLALQFTISSRGQFEFKLETIGLPAPAPDEIVVQMEATPISPADLLGFPYLNARARLACTTARTYHREWFLATKA
jgi:hypothetical protein